MDRLCRSRGGGKAPYRSKPRRSASYVTLRGRSDSRRSSRTDDEDPRDATREALAENQRETRRKQRLGRTRPNGPTECVAGYALIHRLYRRVFRGEEILQDPPLEL